ncbi:unnamed protein product [[Candida] boidinii]|uniref:Unnamed protein product n=1 Tax=Candida boidinii TaxID=5477 RepID=A0A9W6WJB4_CANBO|nr:hypothetical protein B5S33_g4740 [[Candida] boidinii]GME76770.1 unnamed protein product [[Candida] boidinii]GMF99270.1 unnamed protein product [[Candida] boidinii]
MLKSQRNTQSLIVKIDFITKLLSNSKFYDIINGPFEDVYKLDSILSTVCYSSLFFSELIKLQPKFLKLLKSIIIRLNLQNLLKLFNVDSIKNENNNKLLLPITQFSNKISEKLNNNYNKSDLSNKLKTLSNYISDIRIFNRLWATPGLISFGINGVKSTMVDDEMPNWLKILSVIDIVSIVAYQPLENYAYLLDKHWWFNQKTEAIDEATVDIGKDSELKELEIKEIEAKKYSEKSLYYYVLSSKLWAIFVVIELIKLFHKLYTTKGSILKKDKSFNIGLISNLANFPLTIHWSLYDGCLPDLIVGFFGTFSSCMNTADILSNVITDIKHLKLN